MFRFGRSFLFLLVSLAISSSRAQDSSAAFSYLDEHRLLFEMKKYMSENPYRKVFNWDSRLGGNFTLLRYGKIVLSSYFEIQPVIARSYDRRIRVSGQVYRFGFTYTYIASNSFEFLSSLTHISTHITQDIENPFYHDLPRLPDGLLDDGNLFGVAIVVHNSWEKVPWQAKLGLFPIDVTFPDIWTNNRHYPRPLYAAFSCAPWRQGLFGTALSAESEIADRGRSIARFEARVELLFPEQPDEGRLQFFFERFAAQSDIGTSPRFGFFATTWNFGGRIVFRL